MYFCVVIQPMAQDSLPELVTLICLRGLAINGDLVTLLIESVFASFIKLMLIPNSLQLSH
jgi:hypothetical protein